MTLLCERCGAESPEPYGSTPYGSDTMLCPSCAKRAGVGQGDGQAVLDALREALAVELAAIPKLEALLAERAEMVATLRNIEQRSSLPEQTPADAACVVQMARALLAKLPGGA